MSPLERSSRFAAQGINQIGGNIADSINANKLEQQQGDLEAFTAQALSGDPVALKELMVRDPQRAQYVAQQLQQQKQAGLDDDARFQGEIAMNTAGFIEQMHTAPIEQQQAMFEAAIDDPRYDIDEEDRNTFMDTNARKAIIGSVKGNDYAENFFGEKTKFSQGKGVMEGYSFDPSTGTYAINPNLKAKLDEVKEKGKLELKDKITLNKEFTTLTKDTKLIRNTAEDLSKLSKMVDKDGNISGPSSIAMVFKFMKALDPTSVVRESEFQVAENSSGVPENISNMYNKLWNGGKLGPKQVAEFITTAKGLANSSIDSSTTEITDYLKTFEDDLSKNFSKNLLGRIPKRFKVEESASVVSDDAGGVIMTHPTKGDITEAMIQTTMTANGMTRDQVLAKLKGN